MNQLLNFDSIYIAETALGSDLANRIKSQSPNQNIKIVPDNYFDHRQGRMEPDDFTWSKKNIFITPFKGHFFKRCPGATQKTTLTCCNYYVLNLGSQCNFNCSYCYLQSYLNFPIMKIYSNIQNAKNELLDMMTTFPKHPYRVGTGEMIDSLSLDPITLYSRELIPLFKEFPHWTLEFKTKSDLVDSFLDLGPVPNVHVSWSINPPNIINSEEHGTAKFADRILAAKKCLRSGFKIAFHIDPIIYHSEWKSNYSDLINVLTSEFTPDDIFVISLGTLRFQPEQKSMMRERFGMNSMVTQAETFLSENGKMRYDWHLRNEMLQFVYKKIKDSNPKWKVFFCMETPETWASSADKSPMNIKGLTDLFRPLPKVKSESYAD